QMLICAALGWAGYMLTDSLPYWPINPQISSDIWFNFQLDIVRCAWVVLPGAILWGASFPLALAAVAGKGQDPARLVGGVYPAHTVGAIVATLSSALEMVVYFGSQRAEQVLIVISAVSAQMLLAPIAAGESNNGRLRLGMVLAVAAAVFGAGLTARFL